MNGLIVNNLSGGDFCLTVVDKDRFSQIKKTSKEQKDGWQEKINFLTMEQDDFLNLDEKEKEYLLKLIKPKGNIISQDYCECNVIEKMNLQDITNVLFLD